MVIKNEMLEEMLDTIADPILRDKIASAYNDLESADCPLHIHTTKPALLHEIPAGTGHHHWWEGGYLRHLQDMYLLGSTLYYTYKSAGMDFTLEDIVVVILLHDFSKTIAFEWIPEADGKTRPSFRYRIGFFNHIGMDSKTAWLMLYYGIKVTEKQYIAIMHAEGGWAEANTKGRSGNQLSKFIHVLDLFSSQILGQDMQEVNPFFINRFVESGMDGKLKISLEAPHPAQGVALLRDERSNELLNEGETA
jgi:hypothetical protein